jgi:hypothetical protein
VFVFVISGFINSAATTTFAYPPPQTEAVTLIELEGPYPAPLSSSQTQNTSSENLPYPPPESGQTNSGVLPTLAPIPKDRVVAVYSDGYFINFNQNVNQFSNKVSVIGDSVFVPPTYPENSGNPAPLRIIGGDDRF